MSKNQVKAENNIRKNKLCGTNRHSSRDAAKANKKEHYNYLMRMAGLMRGQGSVSSLKYRAIADTGSPVAAVAPAVVVAEEAV